MAPQPILFDYDMSPYGQKIRRLLAATGIPFLQCTQPIVLPRPTLQALGIHYRRIPVLAVGKDIFCDTMSIIPQIQALAGDRAIPVPPATQAYEAFATNFFARTWPLIPAALVTPEFASDRKSIAPVFGRPDFERLRPSALADLKATLDTISLDFLQNNDFISGEHVGLPDLHIGVVVHWALQDLKIYQEDGFDEQAYPAVYQWLRKLPKPQFERISGEQATDLILACNPAADHFLFDTGDALRVSRGTRMSIESADAAPGSLGQIGELVGLTRREMVVALENGLRLHFPRQGYLAMSV